MMSWGTSQNYLQEEDCSQENKSKEKTSDSYNYCYQEKTDNNETKGKTAPVKKTISRATIRRRNNALVKKAVAPKVKSNDHNSYSSKFHD